jgi:hypothetical protein
VIHAIHTAVEGRARFRIEGLLGSESLKRLLDERLAGEKDILSASASSLTGNLLVSYNSNNNHHTIAFLLEDILQEVRGETERLPAPEDGGAPAAAQPESPSPARALPIETLKRFLEPDHEGREQLRKPWHTLEAETVTSVVRTRPDAGLSAAQAAERL